MSNFNKQPLTIEFYKTSFNVMFKFKPLEKEFSFKRGMQKFDKFIADVVKSQPPLQVFSANIPNLDFTGVSSGATDDTAFSSVPSNILHEEEQSSSHIETGIVNNLDVSNTSEKLDKGKGIAKDLDEPNRGENSDKEKDLANNLSENLRRLEIIKSKLDINFYSQVKNLYSDNRDLFCCDPDALVAINNILLCKNSSEVILDEKADFSGFFFLGSTIYRPYNPNVSNVPIDTGGYILIRLRNSQPSNGLIYIETP